MGPGRKLALLALAAGIACVPGLLRAADKPDVVYKFRLAKPAAAVEWSASRGSLVPAGWEVTVTVDKAACEISCAYRLKRDAASRILAPPVVIVHVSYDAVSIPETVTFDPGGLEIPVAASQRTVSRANPYLPGRKWFDAAPALTPEGTPPARPQPEILSANRPTVSLFSATLLRI